MTRKQWLLCSLIPIAGIGLYFGSSYVMAQAQPDDDYASWSPGPAAISKAIGPAPAQQIAADAQDPRHKEFADMFQLRFRGHTPAVPIGIHFVGNNLMKVLCPARMEPWNMDRITLSAWREAKSSFHRSYDIFIYLTYIGIPPVKVGEAHPGARNPDTLQIKYRFPPFYFQKLPNA